MVLGDTSLTTETCLQILPHSSMRRSSMGIGSMSFLVRRDVTSLIVQLVLISNPVGRRNRCIFRGCGGDVKHIEYFYNYTLSHGNTLRHHTSHHLDGTRYDRYGGHGTRHDGDHSHNKSVGTEELGGILHTTSHYTSGLSHILSTPSDSFGHGSRSPSRIGRRLGDDVKGIFAHTSN